MIKSITILKPKKPLNFSGSCNLGIKSSKNKYIFIVNDDVIITKNCIEELVKNTDDNTITGPDSNCNLGFQTDYAYTVKGVQLVPAMLLDQVKHIIPDIYNLKPNRFEIIERSWLAFFATMFTRKCFSDVGLLDENFIYDREDLDHCIRAKNIGKTFKQVFSSYCFHFGGISRKRKHKELGLKHDLDQEHNSLYYFNKYNIKDKPILGFFCWDAFEYWDENSLNSSVSDNKPAGIGGSETQVILLARELAKLNYKVKIFNKCRENHMDSCGLDIEYIPFQDFEKYSKKVKYDYLIAERYLDCFKIPFQANRCFAMCHDVFLILNGRHQHNVELDRIEKYFCLSKRHMQFVHEYHNIPYDKLLMTSNGLDFSRFENKNIKRDSYKMIYSSSPDRGLEVLLEIFPKIKRELPEVTLDIFYGFENFRDQNFVKMLLKKINSTPGVNYIGRIGQNELAEAFFKSKILAYSCLFEETFGITYTEAMAAGCAVVTSKFWGAIDTVSTGGILIDIKENKQNVYTAEYKQTFTSECIKLLSDSDYFKIWQQKGFDRVQRYSWKNVGSQWHEFFQNGIWNEIQ